MKHVISIIILAMALTLSAYTADFMCNPTTVALGDPVLFTSLSYPAATFLFWTFGDGTTSMGNNIYHTYPEGGLYSVTMTATWWAYGNLMEEKEDYINVLEARYNTSDTGGTVPYTASFTDLSLGRYDISIWDFGDGSLPDINPTEPIQHTYTETGLFDVSLTVMDSTGVFHTFTREDLINVTNDELSVQLGSDVTSGSAPLQVHFYAETTGNILSYDWDFGDGTAHSYEADPIHTFTTNGIYTVSVAVHDGNELAIDTRQDYIAVGTVINTQVPIDNAYWPATDSPFIVYGNLEVGADGVLVVEPDVTIMFGDGQSFQVNGQMNANGATFRSLEGGIWGGIHYGSNGYGQLTDCDIIGALNGITLQRDSRSSRETPTLTNLRIKTSNTATRPDGTGLTIQGTFDDVLDTILIEGYEYGIDIDNLQGTTTTPTLTNIRIKTSNTATREAAEAININGLCAPQINDVLIEDYDTGIIINDTSSDPLATPTLTNVRIKTSNTATRSATKAISLINVGDIQIGGTDEADSVVIENYPSGIEMFQSSLRSRATPTLTNIRIKNSNTATRVDTTAISFQGPIDAQINGLTIEDYVTGLYYDGDSGDTRDTPTLTNIRIKNSNTATRRSSCGMRFYNLDSVIIGGPTEADSVIIEGYDVGLSINANLLRSRATPTLTNIRLKTSTTATRAVSHGLEFNGNVTANVSGAILDGFDYGVYYNMNGNYRVRETPTLTNLRLKSSNTATRELTTGIFLMDVDAIIIGDSTHADDIVIDGYPNGVEVMSVLREITTPTLTNLRLKSSNTATRDPGTGIYFGAGTAGLIRDCKIEDYTTGIALELTDTVEAHNNSLHNNATGIEMTSVASPVNLHHNMIYLDSAYGNATMSYAAFSINYSNNVIVHNNTIYDYNYGAFFATSNADWNMNIVWAEDDFNSAISAPDSNSTLSVIYNNMMDYNTTNGNISADPKFINAMDGNFSLRASSPCINAGDPDFNDNGSSWSNDPLDQDPDGTRMDIGAFCYDANSAVVPGQPEDGMPIGNNVSLDFPMVHWSDDYDVFRWTIYLDTNADFNSPNAIYNDNLSENQYEFTAGYLLEDTTYYVKVLARNIRDESSAPLEWSFHTQMPDGSGDQDNGTGLAGDVVETTEWGAGTYQMDIPQVGGIASPSVIFSPFSIPTSQIILVTELGIKGGASGSQQRIEFEEFIARMASVGSLTDLDMAVRVTSTDNSVFNGTLTLNLDGYPYEVNYIYYSIDEGVWIAIPKWESGMETPCFTFDGTTLIITGLSTGRAGGDLDIGVGGNDFTLPVSLSSFAATTTTAGFVQLNWVTESETDMLGYNLYRAEEEDLNEAQLVTIPMIDAQNNASETAYEFIDEDVANEHTYFYWLQIIEMTGSCDFFGPISVTVNGDPDEPPAPEYITALQGNFPNPFNPETRIKFSLAEQTDVEISIYNVKGQRVRTYKMDDCPEGNHTINWTGKDDSGKPVSSSVYFIKMETETYKKIHKALLIK